MYTEIVNLIKNKNVVSFDIFDTLLFRNVSKPIDIFRIIDNEVKEKYDVKNYTLKRIEAESKAREIAPNGEANFDEIYYQLGQVIENKKIINVIKNLELEKEREFIVQNPFMKRIFDYCTKKNKKIILISDMYLNKEFINELLRNSGYGDNLNIYVSCESRKNKGSGKLFELVHDQENVKYEEWMHIGDNSHSDYDIPRSLGIEAFNYKNVNSYENIECSSVFESIVLGIRNNFLYNGNEIDYWEKFGIKCLVPLYLGFTNWIYQMTYNRDNLFFLARDGYIIEKIFNLFPKNKYTKYIYCSRNSLQIPAMLSGSRDNMIKLIINSGDEEMSLKKMFKLCKLEIKQEYEKIIQLYGFQSFDEIVDERKQYDAFKCICAVFDDAEDIIKKDRNLAQKYLIQEGLNDFDIINLVDVGWGGSIQESIQTILNKEVRGYYFGTINVGKYDFYSKSFGYMFDQDNDIYDKTKIFSQVMMYELIFTAPHGSTERYEEKNGKIVPVLKQQDNHTELVQKFQNASLKVIEEIMKYYNYYDNLDKHFCIKFYQDFLDRYNWKDLMEFSVIENDYLIGDDRKFPYVQKLDKQFILNEFKNLEETAEKSLWRGAFIVEGCSNEMEHNAFLDEVGRKYYPELYPSKLRKIIRKCIPYKLRKILNK